MKLNRLNSLTALTSFVASLVCLALGQNATGLIWLVFSVVWLALSPARFRSSIHEPNPASRLVRRLSRMLLWS